MTVINPPLAVQSRTDTNADDFRSALMAGMAGLGSTPLPRGGILPGWGAGLSVAQRGAGANMSVDVGSGACLLPSPTNGTGGWYVVNDATLNVAIAAAHATLPRIDLVIARVADPQYHVGGDGLAAVKVVTGTAAASPVAPTPPTSDGAYLVLGQVAVAAAVSSIVNANITANTSATRAFTVAAGGILPVANAAARTALVNPHLGLHVIEADTGTEYVWTGAAWVPVARPGGWQTYTPTLTGWAASSVLARYSQVGKTVNVVFSAVVSSASGTLTVSLPVAPSAAWLASSSLEAVLGEAMFYDASGSTVYLGTTVLRSSDSVAYFFGNVMGSWNAATPVAVAASDLLRFSAVYEAA